MKNVVDKARQASGRDNIMVCERGVSFGYNNPFRHAGVDDPA
jgi:2-dehydro-3-deoxyphosphooctonate aldolase (KDO 8-P synthase)